MGSYPVIIGGSADVVGTPIKIGTITVNGTTYNKYRKILTSIINYDSSNTYNFAHGISNIHGVLSLTGVVSVSGTYYFIPCVSSVLDYQIYMNINSTNISLGAGNQRRGNNCELKVIVEYY